MKKILALIIAFTMIMVMSAPACALVIYDSYTTVYYGRTAQLTINQDLTTDDITFTTSDESVASVDDNGKIISNGIGTCVITAQNNETGETNECEVRVEFLWWKIIKNIIYFFKTMKK